MEALEALAEDEGTLADDGAGDCDRSMTVADGSSESEDRPVLGLRAGLTGWDFEADGVTETDNELIRSAFLSAILRLMRSRNGSWCGGGSEFAAFLSAAACQISALLERTVHQYFAVPLGLLRNGLSYHDLILFG